MSVSVVETIGYLKETRFIDEGKKKTVLWNIPIENIFPTSSYVSPDFTFLDARWFLSNDPPKNGRKDCIQITLHLVRCNVESSYDMKCSFSISANHQLLTLGSINCTFSVQKPKLVAPHFLTMETIRNGVPSHLPLRNINVSCTLKLLDDPMKLKELDVLSENIKGVFMNGEFCDVTLHVKDKEFKAHKLILAARSPVFAGMFRHETLEKQTGIITISDCDPDSFQEFLEYIYSGKVHNISFNKTLHLYKTADKYDVQELKRFCAKWMKCNLNMKNVLEVIILAEKYDDTILFSGAQEFFNCYFREIFVTSEWKDLLEKDCTLANKLLIEMSSSVAVVKKRKCSEIGSFKRKCHLHTIE